MNNMITNFFATKRILISRIVGVVSFFILLLTRTGMGNNIWSGIVMDSLGLIFIAIAVLGRIWSSMYICGYKNKQVIDEGPYAAVRNPLYFFSFIGVAGIAMTSQNYIFIGLILTLFFLYYPMVIINEERRLTQLLGEAFNAYIKATPRFIPKLSNYHQPEAYQVNVGAFSRSFLDGIWFFLSYIGIQLIKAGHETGIIPVLLDL